MYGFVLSYLLLILNQTSSKRPLLHVNFASLCCIINKLFDSSQSYNGEKSSGLRTSVNEKFILSLLHGLCPRDLN